MLPAVKGIAELPGPTKTPPIFSEMTVIMQGGLQYEDKVDLKGPVAGVEREESQPHGQSPSPFHLTTVLTFDDLCHLIRRIDENSTGISTTTNTLRDGKIQSQTVNHHSTLRKIPDWQDWRQWRYDEAGRLSDFRAGRDKTEINHYSNFKYDAQGRLLSCEYRQNGSDRPFSVTEISYVGNTATESTFDKDGHKYYEHAQIIDDRNRVVDLKVSDVSAGQLKLWYHVTFKYMTNKAGWLSRAQIPSMWEMAMIIPPFPGSWRSAMTTRTIQANRNSTIPKASWYFILAFDSTGTESPQASSCSTRLASQGPGLNSLLIRKATRLRGAQETLSGRSFTTIMAIGRSGVAGLVHRMEARES